MTKSDKVAQLFDQAFWRNEKTDLEYDQEVIETILGLAYPQGAVFYMNVLEARLNIIRKTLIAYHPQ